MPQQVRAVSQKDLPPSVETAYYRKCIELRRRINDIEDNNDNTRLRIKRLNRSITKMRLERAFLLQQLHERMEYNPDESDRSSSPPPTPTDKPHRSKRSHRKTTPPAGGQLGGNLAPQHASPSNQQHPSLQAMNTFSSAQSTPDPGRTQNPFFTSIPNSGASPNAVNGTSHHILPPLHPSHLPALQPSSHSRPHGHPGTTEGYYDQAYDTPRATENDADLANRRRSSAQTSAEAAANGHRQGADTEMSEASATGFGGGFTAVNR
ncbi:hypothetical protein GQ43DRAFT_477531 [Delitschia confertaspora ATCC 74209]|uniref:INO80 complex subunit F domain-containing protein n=1 Tax=Delitschia confertaspora ATCC 74209 TaxID=1513339 RepID=A0A9P4MZG5_9PLEO|nr:hypothetical protein GQ43DRAFT_477531 [Delitschia confertaspora ATCC 74209]